MVAPGINAWCQSELVTYDGPVARAQSRLRRANLLLPARCEGTKKLIEVHAKSSRDAIDTGAFLGRSDVTSTEKMENMFWGADIVNMNKKCGDVM